MLVLSYASCTFDTLAMIPERQWFILIIFFLGRVNWRKGSRIRLYVQLRCPTRITVDTPALLLLLKRKESKTVDINKTINTVEQNIYKQDLRPCRLHLPSIKPAEALLKKEEIYNEKKESLV